MAFLYFRKVLSILAMNKYGYILLFFFSAVFSIQIKAQYNFIITSFDYSSNTTTYGRLNALIQQPSYSPGVSFFSKYGFDVSALFSILGNSDSTFENYTNEFDIIVGYEWEPVKNLVIYPSYSHFFYSKNSNSFKSGFNDNLQLDIDYSLKSFNTGISGNYLVGENSTGLVTFRNSVLLEKEDFLFDNLYVAIQPGIDLTWGNQTYYKDKIEEYLKLNPEAVERQLERLKNNRPRLYDWILNYKKNNPEVSIEDILLLLLPEYYEVNESFNLNAITLNLPAFFMIGSNFAIMANLMYYKPINTPDYVEDDWKFFWSIGISYTFNL